MKNEAIERPGTETRQAYGRRWYWIPGSSSFMIRDGNIPEDNITVYETMQVLGESLDAGGDPEAGFKMRDGRARLWWSALIS